jgi:hypothetical protein
MGAIRRCEVRRLPRAMGLDGMPLAAHAEPAHIVRPDLCVCVRACVIVCLCAHAGVRALVCPTSAVSCRTKSARSVGLNSVCVHRP